MEFYNKNIDEHSEINFKPIFQQILRNKKSVLGFVLGGFLISILIAFFGKKTWQGEFQIVLTEESKSQLPELALNPQLAALTGFNNKTSQLSTEVEILKSQSVLLKTFNYVKEEKNKLNSNQTIRFRNWKEDLNIELEKGTSVLNLKYQDSNKDLILPVLNKISSTYQEYSGVKRLRDIELGIDYFKNQIKIYEDKSFDSFNKAQEFAIENDLAILNRKGIDKEIINVINVESIRIEAANKIRLIDQKLSQINNLSDDPDEIIYIASTIPSLSGITSELRRIDTKLSILSLTFKEKDLSIQELIKEKKLLLNLLEKQAKALLLAQRSDANARLQSSERPKGVLIKYRKLLNIATKDKATLNDLENQYRLLLLEKARNEDPWQLITEPTLLPYPIAPRKFRLIALGLIAGISIGSLYAILLERNKKIIDTKIDLESLIASEFIFDLSLTGDLSFRDSLNLLFSGPLIDKNKIITIIYAGKIHNSSKEKIQDLLDKSIYQNQFEIKNSILEIENNKDIILITSLGAITSTEITSLNQKLSFLDKKLLGILLI